MGHIVDWTRNCTHHLCDYDGDANRDGNGEGPWPHHLDLQGVRLLVRRLWRRCSGTGLPPPDLDDQSAPQHDLDGPTDPAVQTEGDDKHTIDDPKTVFIMRKIKDKGNPNLLRNGK